MAKRKKKGFFKKALLAGAFGIAGAAGAYFASDNIKHETDAYVEQKLNNIIERKSIEVKVGLREEGECTSDATSHAYLSVTGYPVLCYKVVLPGEILQSFSVKIDGKLATRGRMERDKSKMKLIITSATGEKRKEFPATTNELPLSYFSQFLTKNMPEGLHTIEVKMTGINGETLEDKAYWRLK